MIRCGWETAPTGPGVSVWLGERPYQIGDSLHTPTLFQLNFQVTKGIINSVFIFHKDT